MYLVFAQNDQQCRVYSDEVVVSWVVGSSPTDSLLSGGLCDVKSVLGIGRMTSGER